MKDQECDIVEQLNQKLKESADYFGFSFRPVPIDKVRRSLSSSGPQKVYKPELWNRDIDGAQDFPCSSCVVSEIYGRIPAPESIPEFFAILKYYCDALERNCSFPIAGWRGMASIDWYPVSLAARKIVVEKESSVESIDELEKGITALERAQLAIARRSGHDLFGGRVLSDLEMLGRLQHHGFPTRLLDFTEDWRVAAWFASEPSKKLDTHWGIILGIPFFQRHGEYNWPFPQVFEKTSTYEKFIDALEVGIWIPPYFDERMRAQSSVFLAQKITDALGFDGVRQGLFRYCKDSINGDYSLRWYLNYLERTVPRIAISPELKRELQSFLRVSSRTTKSQLFPDIHGLYEDIGGMTSTKLIDLHQSLEARNGDCLLPTYLP